MGSEHSIRTKTILLPAGLVPLGDRLREMLLRGVRCACDAGICLARMGARGADGVAERHAAARSAHRGDPDHDDERRAEAPGGARAGRDGVTGPAWLIEGTHRTLRRTRGDDRASN